MISSFKEKAAHRYSSVLFLNVVDRKLATFNLCMLVHEVGCGYKFSFSQSFTLEQNVVQKVSYCQKVARYPDYRGVPFGKHDNTQEHSKQVGAERFVCYIVTIHPRERLRKVPLYIAGQQANCLFHGDLLPTLSSLCNSRCNFFRSISSLTLSVTLQPYIFVNLKPWNKVKYDI